MKKITVYADFDFLASPQEIGTLSYERVRSKDHFVFEYSHEWLKQHAGIVLSGDLLLSERFDRTADGRRIHFASAMSLLGLDDGAGSSTGNGYLDIVDFILQGCVDAGQNLRELYRRVAFNVMFGNTDDHFRNHGFLLTPKGWTLSPAYDINPGTKLNQCLLINQYTEQSDASALLQASGSYMLEQQEASEIIEEVRTAIKDWRKTATELKISHNILESYCNRWDNL